MAHWHEELVHWHETPLHWSETPLHWHETPLHWHETPLHWNETPLHWPEDKLRWSRRSSPGQLTELQGPQDLVPGPETAREGRRRMFRALPATSPSFL